MRPTVLPWRDPSDHQIQTEAPMTDSPTPPYGKPAWFDLSVPDADSVKDFYSAVCGWTSGALDMGGYSDYTMATPTGEVVAGVCHARGPNANLPPVWLMYVSVPSLEDAVETVRQNGGSILEERVNDGMAVVRDPAGAVFALWQQKPA